MVSQSSTKLEYQAMAQPMYEVLWVHQLLEEVSFKNLLRVKLWCNNQVTIHIAHNIVFHKQTIHRN